MGIDVTFNGDFESIEKSLTTQERCCLNTSLTALRMTPYTYREIIRDALSQQYLMAFCWLFPDANNCFGEKVGYFRFTEHSILNGKNLLFVIHGEDAFEMLDLIKNAELAKYKSK